MKIHIVKAGESLSSIARQYGFLDWRPVYNHGSNATLRGLRPNPSLIRPGDQVAIPDPPPGKLPVKAQVDSRSKQAAAQADIFTQYLQHLSRLEQAALREGHTSLQRRMTDFRLIYYPNTAPARQYFGIVVGGGTWSILIPGAASHREPRSWSSGELAASRRFLAQHKVVRIRETEVDLGHLFAGLDAGNHPTSISLGGIVNLHSNMAAATYGGDLGSVVGEYVIQGTESVHDMARRCDHARLNRTYDAFISPMDTAGNADAYALVQNLSRSVAQNLEDYYQATSGGVTRRFTQFNTRAALSNRSRLVDLVFNSALAYLASNGRRDQVLAVTTNPGPQLFGYSLWELYYNVSQWTVDLFTSRIRQAMQRE